MLTKRFFKLASIKTHKTGYSVQLDDKPIRTPGRKLVVVKHSYIADSLAFEWNSQKEQIDAANMPLTRIVNSALDGVAENQNQVADEIGGYISSDLICYRADGPEALVKRQANHWDPVLNWAEKYFNIQLRCSTGIVHIVQPQSTIKTIRKSLEDFDSFELAALHTITTICSSVLLALAMAKGVFDESQVWEAAFVDENWNVEKWGEDEENKRVMAFKRAEFEAANVILEAGKAGH